MNSSNTKQTVWVIELEKAKFAVTFKWSIKIPHITVHFSYDTVVCETLTAMTNSTTKLHIDGSQYHAR